MKIKSSSKLPSKINTLILPFPKGVVDRPKITKLSGIKTAIDFEGNFKESLTLYHPSKNLKIVLLGLGAAEEVAKCANAFRSITFNHQKKWGKHIGIDLNHLSVNIVYHAALGCQLATYNMGNFKTEKNKKSKNNCELSLFHTHKASKKLIDEALHTAHTQMEIMRLVNSPSNEKTPRFIANYALQSGKKNGFKVKILGEKELKKEGLHALLAVGQGSQHESVLIQLEYKPAKLNSKKPRLGLVGKGITFDTGGISIKQASNMHYMKSDMGGAAAVLGAIELAAKLKLNIHLVGIIPSAENSVDANSIRPGDVIQSHSGKTIEVIDTDAEGRLILADGLSYIQQKFQPEVIIDLATLTGSCVRTLGYTAAGLFTQSETLIKELIAAGQETHERVWPFPLWQDYEEDIHSDIADIRNFSGKMVAGAISAAKFLEFFIKKHPNWAHLDIAGVAFGDSEYTKMKSATGYGIRLLAAYMKRLISNHN